MRKPKYIAVCICAFLMLIFSGCGGGTELASKWKSGDVVSDWKGDAWKSSFTEKSKVFLKAQNDNESLNVCICTEDRGLKAQFLGALGQSFTIWLYTEGNEDKKAGIRFPVENTFGMQAPGAGREPVDIVAALSDFKSRLNNFVVVDKDGVTVPGYDKKGIALKAEQIEDKFVFELEVPLKPKDAKKITIALETSDPPARKKDKDSAGGNFGGAPSGPGTGSPQVGSGGGGFGGHGGGHMRGGGGKNRGGSERFEVSFDVILAENTPVLK